MENNKPRLMLLDDFGGQKTSKVLKALNSVNFTTSFIPEGCTSYVQPIDTALNKTFKKKISEQEMDQNPAKWDDSEKFCVGDRWISTAGFGHLDPIHEPTPGIATRGSRGVRARP